MNDLTPYPHTKLHPSASALSRMFALAGLVCTLVTLSMTAGRADGSKPPSTGELFSFDGTLNLSELKTDEGVTASITDLKGKKRIKVDFAKIDGYPGVGFPIPRGGWDLSGFTGVEIELNNPSPDPLTINMRVDNDGDWHVSPWSTEVTTLQPGETKTLRIIFGRSFNQPGFKLNPAAITNVRVFAQALKNPASILMGKPKVFKDDSVASSPSPEEPPPSQTYITATTSPSDHTHPYGQDWKLVKDWTFGNKRADATVHNKGELDQDFYYRYIYDKGKLDTLSTYWTVHRDYPEGDPKSLHVFGDNTLTLKGRIPRGGGLHKGGIESGMLRAKIPFTPGMYVEMRCKVTKGVGAWPAFWLDPGIEYDNGTYSALDWPPEIDILEFFGFRNRAIPQTFSSNIQTDNHPEKYGHPHDIFTVFNHSDYTPGMDFSAGFHVFALDWVENKPIWLLDGHPIKQTYYEWHSAPAHILVTNQVGIEFAKDDMRDMIADESNWDYVIDYIRVWKHPGVIVPSTTPPQASNSSAPEQAK